MLAVLTMQGLKGSAVQAQYTGPVVKHLCQVIQLIASIIHVSYSILHFKLGQVSIFQDISG